MVTLDELPALNASDKRFWRMDGIMLGGLATDLRTSGKLFWTIGGIVLSGRV